MGKTVDTMYYLNDDFSDENIHFKAALKRSRINNGQITSGIAIVRQQIRCYEVYDW